MPSQIFPLMPSPDGQPILATPAGVLIHTTAAGTLIYDRITLYVTNVSGVAGSVAIHWGDPSGVSGSELYRVIRNAVIPGDGLLTPLVSGLVLRNGKTVYASTGGGDSNKFVISGFFERVTP